VTIDAGRDVLTPGESGTTRNHGPAHAVGTLRDVVPVAVPSCLDGFVVNVRRSSSERRFSGQVGNGFEELLKSKSIFVVVSVGDHFFGHFLGGDSADDDDGYLREAFPHYLKKLNPRLSSPDRNVPMLDQLEVSPF